MNAKEINESMELAQSVLGQWITYRQQFMKAMSPDPITPEEETEFLETASSLSQNIRKLGQRLDDKKFPTRKNEISGQLKKAISITHLQQLPDADKQAFYLEWHMSLMYLSRTVGALKFLAEGYVPQDHGGAKGGKKGKSGGGMGKPVIIILVLLLLGGGTVAVLHFLGVI